MVGQSPSGSEGEAKDKEEMAEHLLWQLPRQERERAAKEVKDEVVADSASVQLRNGARFETNIMPDNDISAQPDLVARIEKADAEILLLAAVAPRKVIVASQASYDCRF